MIIVDHELKKRAAAGNPIRVGMVGAGFMGRGIVNQIVNSVPGMQLVAISNRHAERAERAYQDAGLIDVVEVSTIGELQDAILAGKPAVTDDPFLLCDAPAIEAIIE